MAAECSIVVPLYNAAPQLPDLHCRLTKALRQLALPHEVIYIDNGSTDETALIIEHLHRQDASVRGMVLSRRFDTQAALRAGLEAATGRAVITLDAQHGDPPDIIPSLIQTWHQGYEIILAQPRTKSYSLRRWTTLGLSTLLRSLTGLTMPAAATDLVLMDRRAVEEWNALTERTACATGLRSWLGFRQIIVEYDRPQSERWPAARLCLHQCRAVVEGLFAFSSVPLRLVVLLGLILLLGGTAGFIAAASGGWQPAVISTNTLVFTTIITAIAGLQLIALGVVGAYVMRIYREVCGRPNYVSRERIGFQPHPRLVSSIVQHLPNTAAIGQESATRQRLQTDRLSTSSEFRSPTIA